MRSLYVDDIPGARPKKHVYTKDSYFSKHQEQIYRFARKPEQDRIIDWTYDRKRIVDPFQKDNDDVWKTKRTLRKSMDARQNPLSQSVVLTKQAFFGQHVPQAQMSKSSVLRSSGRNSLSQIKKAHQSPYFPHMYVQPKMGQSNKWMGSKVWQHEPTKIINLPDVGSCYFKKWD